MPRIPYCSLAGTPMLIHDCSSSAPVGGGNWLLTSPPVRLGPYAPPPMIPGGLAPGSVVSKYDHPRVWHRAQLFMNAIWPSVADCVVCCHPSAADSVSCFSSTNFVYVEISFAVAAAASCAWAATNSARASVTHLSAAAW